jgi:nitroimidazol reductase NimA-like FMN-containing flavoprotein (pyridoxamine 5'-phosphate oxidase superfamily)
VTVEHLLETTNLDRYGDPALPWARPRDLLEAGEPPTRTFFLGTADPDGRPHAAGIGVHWHDGDLYFTSGPATRKARDLAARPDCAISVSLDGIDIVLEGRAVIVRDEAVLRTVVKIFRDGGWPAEVEDGRFVAPYSAPTAGPPPWDLYRFTFHTAFGVATREPYGGTRWRFDTARSVG